MSGAKSAAPTELTTSLVLLAGMNIRSAFRA